MSITLADARCEMMTKIHEGTVCPCCSKKVKLYKRKLNKDMAKFLILIVNKYQHSPRFYATSSVITGGNKNASDGIYLVHWDLLEKSTENNRGTQGVGLFRPTAKGIEFAYNMVVVPTHVHLLNNVKQGESFDRAYIKQVLGEDYDTLEAKYLA